MASLPYDYYPAVLAVLTEMGKGLPRTKACDKYHISVVTFEEYVNREPQLQMMLIEAERRGHDALADALLNPDNHELYGQSNPQMAKVVSDNIKWFLSKKDTKRFGDRLEIKHELTLDKAITDAMDRARERAINGETIEHDPIKSITSIAVEDVIDVLTEDDELMAELLS